MSALDFFFIYSMIRHCSTHNATLFASVVSRCTLLTLSVITAHFVALIPNDMSPYKILQKKGREIVS